VDAVVGRPYPLAPVQNPVGPPIVAFGGTLPYAFSSSALPGGLTLNVNNGQITGTPAGPAGDTFVTFQVTDSSTPPQTAKRTLKIHIADPLAITPPWRMQFSASRMTIS